MERRSQNTIDVVTQRNSIIAGLQLLTKRHIYGDSKLACETKENDYDLLAKMALVNEVNQLQPFSGYVVLRGQLLERLKEKSLMAIQYWMLIKWSRFNFYNAVTFWPSGIQLLEALRSY